jgi:uncharacterized protein (TIGR02145 family)
MAFFKFGSVIGFHNRKTGDPNTGTTAWPTDGSAIHFNPTNLVYGSQITAYAPATYNAATSNALPNIPGYVSADYPKNVTVADGYVTVANLKAGKGDPCMLVGYTGAQLAAMSDSELQGVLDNAAYRLPTDAENKFFAGTNANTTTSAHWTANSTNATDPGIGKFPLVANLLGDAFTYTLPAAGLRNTTNGPVNSQGPYGSYWSATPYSNAGGHRLSFDSGTVYPSGSNDYSRGFSIRCVRRAPEQTDYYFVVVNSSDESMGTVDARLKTGRPGTTFTVTATPKEYNYGVLNWTAEGGATVTKTGPHTAMVTINSNGTVTANFATANVEVGIRDAMGPAWTSRVPAGSQFPVTAKPSEGYVFKNWTTAGGVTVSSTTANPTMVTANSMGSVQANFAQIIDQILYFAPDGKLSLAKWDNNVVKVSNMAFFKFGSVIGFHNRKTGDPNTGTTAWPGVSAILFNPMTPSEAAKITAYAPASYNAATSNALPNIPGYVSGDYPKNVTVADGYVTVANLKAGKGDPCMLVGYTGAQLAAMTDSELQGVLDNAAYRLPTQDENKLFAGVDVNTTTTAHWTAGNSADYAGNPGIGKFPLVANSVGTQYQYTLPAAGYRYTTTGAVNSQGSYGYYWSATPTSDTHGYRLYFGSGYVYVTDSSSYAYGFPVRCVPR